MQLTAANDRDTRPMGQVLQFPLNRSRPSPAPAPLVQGGNRVVDRLLAWADDAKRAGRRSRADELLLMAWNAYDAPLGAAR